MIALIALCGMAQLLVRNVPDALAKQLKIRAAERGVSAEEEHRRILQEALDPASAVGVKSGKPNLLEHIMELGKIAPDFEFGNDRPEWKRREIEF